MDNIKRVLESACLNYISSEDDDEEENSEDIIENSPTNTQTDIVGKQKTIIATSYLRASNKLPMIDREKAPMSPLPAMSPETTKLVNFLSGSDILENNDLTNQNNKDENINDIAVNNNNKNLLSEQLPENTLAYLQTPNLLLDTGEVSVKENEKVIMKKMHETHEDESYALPVSLLASVASSEMPKEKSIKAPPFSPLTPRPASLQQPGDVLEKEEDKRYTFPVSLPASVASREMPEEKSIEAPPFSPLTPRPGCLQQPGDVLENEEDKSYALPVSLPASVASREMPEEKSIEAPPFSPLTPRPVFLQQPGDVLEKQEDKNYALPVSLPASVASSEMPEEKSIVAPPYSPLTPRIITTKRLTYINVPRSTSPISDETVAEEYSDDLVNYRADCESKEYGEALSSENSLDESQSILTAQKESQNMSNQPEKQNVITSSSASTEMTKQKRIETLPISPISDKTDFEENSDDSVKDPDFKLTEDDDTVSSEDGLNEPINNTLASNDTTEADPIINSSETITEETGRPRKGRKRKYGGFDREERKKRKYQNLSYMNSRKNLIQPKLFIDYKCNCAKKCHDLITVEKRLTEFNKFYELGSYDAQNMYIAACVKERPVKRRYVSCNNNSNVSKKKTYSRQYFLQGIPICREMFVKTLHTTPKRINTSLCKIRSEERITDKRGLHSGHNKVSLECELFLINVIKKLPTYVSHYRRNECNDAKFLRPDMTFSKIYNLYCDEAASAGIKTVSYAKAKQVFLKKFNLRTKALKKDTCNKCDYLNNKLNGATDEEKAEIKKELDIHQQTAEFLQKQMKIDLKIAKDNPYTETITFDLQKTLPLPRIPTNIVFYKRQLWVYNLGIHTGSDDKAHCNVWVEGEAGRGSQEVGSCLIKHALERLKSDVTHLILWSDSCGGQNRNIKLTLMLKALLDEHPTLEYITMRFLESGHSFLPNDRDFGRIECALNLQQRLYTPSDYIEIMKKCKKTNPMVVHRMQAEDFLSSSKLESIITNRKKSVDGKKVSWLKTKEILLKKEDMFTIYMKESPKEDCEPLEVNIKKNLRGRHLISKRLMEPLWSNGKTIPVQKLNDLKSMLHLIPIDAQSFYKNLKAADIEDDLEGFSGEPDFEMENMADE